VARPTYRTFVAERHVDAPRSTVWAKLVDLLEAGLTTDGGLGPERLLSFEPPWRRVGRFELPPLGVVDHTVALRDDGDETHVVWAYVAEWPFAAPEDAGVAAADAVLARLQVALTSWADTLAASAAGGEAVLAHRERHEDEQQGE
jgi:hypothetical protein